MRVDYEIGRPLKLKQYPTLASLFQTHKSKQYDGWYSYNDLFWKDPLPGTLERARSKTGPHSIAQIHVSRFFCISEALGYSQSSVVESALSFGATAPFREQRVAIAGDYHTPEVSTALLAGVAYGSFLITSSYWLKVPNLLKDMVRERASVLMASPSELTQRAHSASGASFGFHYRVE